MNEEFTQASELAATTKTLTMPTPAPVVARWLPDESQCTARRVADSDLVICQSDANHCCEFALDFGLKRFCRHPRRLEIAARTPTIRFA